MRLKRYNDFINEVVYIGLKGLKGYEIKAIRPGTRKSDLGHAIVDLIHFDDKKVSLLIEIYGQLKDKELIVKIYSSDVSLDEDKFRYNIEKMVYILNKNRLGEYFKIDSINYDPDLESYAILKSDNIVPIDKLEQVLTSTKIINPKVKKTNDLDKMIYQTHNEYKDNDINN